MKINSVNQKIVIKIQERMTHIHSHTNTCRQHFLNTHTHTVIQYACGIMLTVHILNTNVHFHSFEHTILHLHEYQIDRYVYIYTSIYSVERNKRNTFLFDERV